MNVQVITMQHPLQQQIALATISRCRCTPTCACTGIDGSIAATPA